MSCSVEAGVKCADVPSLPVCARESNRFRLDQVMWNAVIIVLVDCGQSNEFMSDGARPVPRLHT